MLNVVTSIDKFMLFSLQIGFYFHSGTYANVIFPSSGVGLFHCLLHLNDIYVKVG